MIGDLLGLCGNRRFTDPRTAINHTKYMWHDDSGMSESIQLAVMIQATVSQSGIAGYTSRIMTKYIILGVEYRI